MFTVETRRSQAALIALLGCLVAAPRVCRAAQPLKLSGAITGLVTNSLGVPQMGAVVVLYNRQDRAYERAITDERGEFKFLGLFPDSYSLRISLASFVPAMKRNILVQPGMRSVLAVNLSTLFSSIQFAYPPVENGSFMTDDWKWILRSASATRPVLRFKGEALAKPPQRAAHATVFSDTRGVLRLSAGDGPMVSGIGSEADLGTAFALATSVFGNNSLEVSGNLGYGSQTGVPAAAFRTTYSRTSGGPQVSVTMRQLLLPGRVDGASDPATTPMLRSVATSVDDRAQIAHNVSLQYGFTLDSVSFVEHLNSFSPYARLVYSLGDHGEVAAAYTSGNARPDLAGEGPQDSEFLHDLNTLALFPRLSLLGGRPKMQRGDNYELSYTRKARSRVYRVSGYRESVANAALSLIAPDATYGGDLLPDLFTGNAIFNAGNYQSSGYTASVTQNLGESLSATVMYGGVDVLSVTGDTFGTSDELRSMMRSRRRQAVMGRIAATSPWTGTHVIASYQWTGDSRAVMPGQLYTTQTLHPLPGLNFYIRQPIPGLSNLPWRIEATADLRNLLAQGYLPLSGVNGQQVVLVETPRSFRGGLSFIF